MSLRSERGITLVEMLVGMTISLIVLGATLTTFDGFYRNARANDQRFDNAEVARNALDTQARQLRNLAKRLNNSAVIDRVGRYDLIFQTSDPKRTWVRYCLDTTTAPASESRGRLWEAALALPAATTSYGVTPEMRAGCPGSGWTRSAVVADHVTNKIAGQDRPVFSYSCIDGTALCTGSAATFDQIVNVSAQTIVDSTPGTSPREMKVSSGVHLRNQNQAPVASLVATPTLSRTILLNGSGSTDYEGRTLSLWWFKGTMPTSIACDKPLVTVDASGQRTMWGGSLIGDGITLSHAFPLGDGIAGTTYNVGLVVCDPGDRFGSVGVPPGAPISVKIPN